MATLTIDNFRGGMTINNFGDINSGRSYVQVCSGQNPFIRPGQLTWAGNFSQIDPSASVITDLIMAAKERVESGISYVYAIGHTGRLYKIQVNDPATFNPNYDNPVLLATLTSGSPTFKYGGSIDFFGSTERIYIGHDVGVTRIDFAGTNETAISGTWTANVPRPIKQFVGTLCIGNGSNIAVIDSTGTQTANAKLSPGFPTNSQVRDIDVSPDGNYLEMVVSSLALGDITSATQDNSVISNSSSYIFKWNGTDIGYTAFTTFPSFSLTANTLFQNYQYTFGYDQFGSAVYNPTEKFLSTTEVKSPNPNGIISTGNLLIWMSPTYFNGVLEADLFCWGFQDFETGHPVGYWDLMFLNATAPETDIIQVPCMISTSNGALGSSSNGYPNNVFGNSKIYFSTLETSSTPTTKYRFYKWNLSGSPKIPNSTVLLNAIYQTQTQLFPGKITVSSVRIYGDPWIANNSFQVDLIGQDGNPIVNGTKVFTAGANPGDGILTIGTDYCWWGPDMAPTYALGLAITNKGTTNHVINKIEIDYEGGGH